MVVVIGWYVVNEEYMFLVDYIYFFCSLKFPNNGFVHVTLLYLRHYLSFANFNAMTIIYNL